ncbi:MAG: polysaccharide pyruvyl transferase family protein [Clostridia bacterium]|nr:polysaccharide pyruvyl transferase family protein [Clostridia bacterium]
MKKVAIITMCGNSNYGNKLQNYALQETLTRYDLNVYTIWNETFEFYSKRHVRIIIQQLKNIVNHIFGRNYHYTRYKYFIRFNNSFLKYYKTKIYSNKYDALINKFDCFFIGSDQIWKYTTQGPWFGTYEFGLFEESKKMFSYAASFGISEIPETKREIYNKGLNHMNKISVREQNAVSMVKDLSGRTDARWVLDPTMLLPKDKWSALSLKPKFVEENEKYILVYFLGKSVYINTLRRIALEKGLKIICLNNGSYESFHSGPREFVYLFEHAEMIITDSFHACTFSLIFEKPFYVFERKDNELSMLSRIDSLLSRYDLLDRKITDLNEISFDCLELSDEIKSRIVLDKNNSLKFIEECINEEKT